MACSLTERASSDRSCTAADRIEFGFPDSYSLIFTFDDDEIQKLLDQFSAPKTASAGSREPGETARAGGGGACASEFACPPTMCWLPW